MAIANTFIEKAQKFISVLDEIYAKESTTAILEVPGTEFIGTNKVRIPKIALDGAADYDRVNGYVSGAVEVSYDELELMFDRGRRFRIDIIDDDESAFNLYRSVATEYTRTKEIPEVDAVRYMRLAENAGKVVEVGVTNSNVLDLFDDAEEYMNNEEITATDRILFVSAETYKAMKQTDKISRRLDVNSNNGGINRVVSMLDGQVPVIVVPKKRFYDVIQLNDGTTSGQTAGGFIPVAGTSKELNFIFMPRSSGKAVTKRHVSKIITPQVNQEADAYDIPYRLHHDLIVNYNRKAGIYVSRKTTAIT